MSERETTFTQRARGYLSEGEPEEAINILDSWLRLSPDDAGGWEVVREAHLELRQLFEAEHAAREVVRLRPESADAWCRLGSVLGMAGSTEESREALHHALSIDPEFEQARAELERLAPSTQQRTEAPSPASATPPVTPTPEKAEVQQAQAEPSQSRPVKEMPPPPPPPSPARRARHEEGADGWKVRSLSGMMYGPYTEDQLAEHLLQGEIGQSWRARFGSGRIMTVREALGPERCDEVLRQRSAKLMEERSRQQDGTPAADSYGTALPCPHCGQRAVTAEKRSASCSRIAVFVLGLFFLPVWLLLLVIKDKIRYTCLNCGTHWDGKA